MSVTVASNRFILSSVEIWAELYQQAHTFSDFRKLGKWLVAECEKAQAFRQTEKLKELSQVLSAIPLQEYQLIGNFYQAYSHSIPDPRRIYEEVAEKSITYKAKAFTALARMELGAGNCDFGIKLCNEAIRYSHNLSTTVNAARSIAVIQSTEGFHDQALKNLEAIAPLIDRTIPIVRYQYFNSLAVELGETGRLKEARDVCRIMLASPYAFAYPEWRETSNDIALRGYKSRSVIYFDAWNIAKNVLYLPENDKEESTQDQPGTISTLEDWKKKMVKEPNGENLDEMSEQDMIAKLLELMAQGVNDKQKIRALLEHALKLFSKD